MAHTPQRNKHEADSRQTSDSPPEGAAVATTATTGRRYAESSDELVLDGRELLRFVISGGRGDGKSTLLDRLSREAARLYGDQAVRPEDPGRKARVEPLGYGLLADSPSGHHRYKARAGIDCHHFCTESRRIAALDASAGEHCTRSLLVAASTADVAVVVIDARKGVLTEVRQQTYLISLLGVPHVILVVNKLDLVGYDSGIFHGVANDYRSFTGTLGFRTITAVPCSASLGDNLAEPSLNTPWYAGPSLMGALEEIDLKPVRDAVSFRMPVQSVSSPDRDSRGYRGQVVAGAVTVGDRIRVSPAGTESNVARIIGPRGDLEAAVAGEAVTVALEDATVFDDVDVLSAAADPAEVADQFEADVVWLGEEPMIPGRHYLMRFVANEVGGHLSSPKHRVDVNTMEHMAAKTLERNEVGLCTLTLDRQVPFEAHSKNPAMGSFAIIDRVSNETVGVGMLRFALRRSQNIHWQHVEVTKEARSAMNGHKPAAIWFTGLSGSGKSTIANLVERQLHAMGVRTYLLDGDNIRHGLCKDLGFTDGDRIENMRRVAEMARLMVDAGLVVLVSFISPFREERRIARNMFATGEFCEVYVDAPVEILEARDTKGLYAKARAGKISHFTGVDSPYEPPDNPEVWLSTSDTTPDDCASRVVSQMRHRGILESA